MKQAPHALIPDDDAMEVMVAAMIAQSTAYPIVPPDYTGKVEPLHPFVARQCLLAAIRAQPAPRIAIKRLDWKLSRAVADDPDTMHYGYWMGGWYGVDRAGPKSWKAGTHDNGQWRSLGHFASKNDAKAACQADLEQRLGEMLGLSHHPEMRVLA